MRSMMRHKPGKLSLVLTAVGVATVLIGFQNCGDLGALSAASNSALCRAQAANKVSFKIANLNCGDMSSFLCERRIFSPTASGLSHSMNECAGSSGLCVDVDIHEFNTEAARSRAAEGAFLPGGEYNREEVRCHHRVATDAGVAVITGEGESLEEALAQVMTACERATEAR